MFNPAHITRLADLLRQGAVLLKPIQPFEAHMQYVPQWMCDFNLYGCAFLDAKKFAFRGPLPSHSDITASTHSWHDQSVSSSMLLDPEKFPRQSHCPIEVDINVEDISNRLEIRERRIHHQLAEPDQPVSFDEKLVHSMAGLWRDETRRRRVRMGLQESDGSPFPPEVLVSVSADPRNNSPAGWIHEEEYRKKLDLEVQEEIAKENNSSQSLSLKENETRTVFESVETLFHANLRKWESFSHFDSDEASDVPADVKVDESRILELEAEDLVASDEEDEASGLEQEIMLAPGERLVTANNPRDESSPNATISLEAQTMASYDNSYMLNLFGVRSAGEYDRVEEDLFDIKTAYRSIVQRAASEATVNKRDNGMIDQPRKRRKLSNGISRKYENNTIALHKNGSQSLHPDSVDPRLKDSIISNDHTPDTSVLSENAQVSAHEMDGTLNLVETSQKLLLASDHESPIPATNDRRSQRSEAHQLPQGSGPKSVTFDLPVSASKRGGGSSDRDRSRPRRQKDHANRSFPYRKGKQEIDLSEAFAKSVCGNIYVYAIKPPGSRRLMRSFKRSGLPTMLYQDAYYSDERDVPELAREYAGKNFKLESLTVPYLPIFNPSNLYLSRTKGSKDITTKSNDIESYADIRRTCATRYWEIQKPPPIWKNVKAWAQSSEQSPYSTIKDNRKPFVRSQIEGPTQKNTHGFKYSQKQAGTSVRHETQYMSVMSLEVHVNTREKFVPDPEKDSLACVFWRLQSDGSGSQSILNSGGSRLGAVFSSEVCPISQRFGQGLDFEIEKEDTELDLINRIVDIVRENDPDILTGFEVHNGSWGFVIERARRQYDYDLCEEFSRTKAKSHGRIGKTLDPWGFNQTSTIRITGRHMINIWRAMRGELNLLQYTFENIAFHTLHRRLPHFAFRDLTTWYRSGKPRELYRVIEYYLLRTQLDIEILDQTELIPRTSEQARLLGVDFFSVFSRGSQFKVESLMFRIAKPENFLLISPSRKQVGQQNALECLPLVMEPQSSFYPSPLLVLDFQSLYPSVMIAYNYCYSTFLGRIIHWRGQNKMGFIDYERQNHILEMLKDHINIAPNGMMYARPEVRKSLLAKMLGEILETRVMVKSGMKVDRDDKTLQRLLNNRQLALKLIANVTYGYTSASFSGRMPCSEIADSIVQTGRETLEKAIALIHSVERWGAEVVYGDTDSLFVYLKGRTREEAFGIGEEIAKAVTRMNPKPIKLKFEKVYHPCVLLAKKRYVGFKYESRGQVQPDFDAKGIETVRRDGTPAEQKIEEKVLKILFRTADLSSVKAYFQKQCARIMKGQVSIQDFCFAREVKLGTYSDRGPPPPGALISTRRMLEDPRTEPQYGERVPYVVIAGAPGARLIDRCVAPEVLLYNDQHELDAEYYISKNLIPPLDRIFNLVGANVKQWYDEMPKYHKVRKLDNLPFDEAKNVIINQKTLESYLKASACVVCRRKLEEAEFPLCPRCFEQPERSLLMLKRRLVLDERKSAGLQKVCKSCSKLPFSDVARCDSKDCPVFYARTRHASLTSNDRKLAHPVAGVLEDARNESLMW